MTERFVALLLFLFLAFSFSHAEARDEDSNLFPLITKEHRKTVTATDSGQITAVEVRDGDNRLYHLHFITLEPNSLFLPVLLQQDMVFYVHTGEGRLGWVDDSDMRCMDIERGDICRLHSGSIFYIESKPKPTGEKLRLYAIFSITNIEDSHAPFIGTYSTLSDLILGFDEKVLQTAFKVPKDVIEELMMTVRPQSIVDIAEKDEMDGSDWRAGIIEALVGVGSQKKGKAFNILKKKPDFKNCNGWSLAVNSKDYHALRGSNIGLFLVNLTQGSMMGPHWNPRATEIAIVIHGQGMVQIVCPKEASQCQNSRFMVKEGDVFVVPRFHPMAQISFANDSLVFVGFSTMPRRNYPQFLAGKRSALQILNKEIVAMSFNVSKRRIKEFLASQDDEIILECPMCAEEEMKKMEEEKEKQRQEEEAKEREEEEARKREEEEARKREEEEEARKREEEARKREEEEARRREEEEEARKREEEEEARKRDREREEEEARKREEEEEARKREREREEEEARKREEEEEARKREREREEEEARKREEEARREEEEARKREQEREEEEARKREEEARREEEEARERKEEARKREEEETESRKEEGEAREREEQEREEREREEVKWEEETRREEQEREEMEREEEEARRKEKQERKEREREREKEGWEEEEARGERQERKGRGNSQGFEI